MSGTGIAASAARIAVSGGGIAVAGSVPASQSAPQHGSVRHPADPSSEATRRVADRPPAGGGTGGSAGAWIVGRRALLAVAGGLALYGGHPPLDQGWLGVVAVAPLLALARDVGTGPRPGRAGFGWGVVAGLAFFLPLLTWIARFGVVAWVLLGLVEALFVAAFVAVMALWGPRRWRPLAAVVFWVAAEAARSRVPLGGFPWGLLGYTQHGGGLFLPAARTLGVLGVGALLAALAACGEEFLARRPWEGRWLRAIGPGLGAAGVLGVAAVLGVAVPAPAPTGETVDIAAVQGNDIELPPVADRSDLGRVQDVAARMLAAAERLLDDDRPPPEVLVWPENALDADPREVPELAETVAEAQELAGGATLLAGTLLDGPRPGTFRNAIVQYTPDGTVADVYDKRVLVPFGEYVPWRSLLGGLPPLQAIPSDGVPGSGAKVFEIGGAPIGPVTCYESLFPGLVRDQVRAGAQVLVVSTNNASFGRTPASRQHLAFTQLRTVETGRWALHAGISGISAVVAPDGSVSQRTELFTQAVVRADLPLVDGSTPYLRFGDVVGVGSRLLAALAAAWLAVDRRRVRRRWQSS